jgi:peptidoglycan/LPS O-acetylase OafA/YrhL
MYFALLDILRFLSAVAVMFHHTFDFHYGKLGVYLFFMISGFVIYFSLNKGIKEYALGRFLRLYPLFWLCCTLTYVITLIYGVNLPIERYFVSMLLVNDGKIAQMVDGSYWTLTFELLFYIYIAVFVKLFSTKKLEWFYVGWLLISFLSFYLQLDQNIIAKLLCVRFAPYFVFGGMLALLVDRYKSSTVTTKLFYSGTLAASAFLAPYISHSLRLQENVIHNMTASFDPDEMIIIESFFILVPLIVYFSLFNFAKNKKFAKLCIALGGITYPLYLLHWKIGETFIKSYGGVYGSVTLYSCLVAFGIFVVAYVLSVYDVRLRAYLKHKLSRYA